MEWIVSAWHAMCLFGFDVPDPSQSFIEIEFGKTGDSQRVSFVEAAPIPALRSAVASGAPPDLRVQDSSPSAHLKVLKSVSPRTMQLVLESSRRHYYMWSMCTGIGKLREASGAGRRMAWAVDPSTGSAEMLEMAIGSESGTARRALSLMAIGCLGAPPGVTVSEISAASRFYTNTSMGTSTGEMARNGSALPAWELRALSAVPSEDLWAYAEACRALSCGRMMACAVGELSRRAGTYPLRTFRESSRWVERTGGGKSPVAAAVLSVGPFPLTVESASGVWGNVNFLYAKRGPRVPDGTAMLAVRWVYPEHFPFKTLTRLSVDGPVAGNLPESVARCCALESLRIRSAGNPPRILDVSRLPKLSHLSVAGGFAVKLVPPKGILELDCDCECDVCGCDRVESLKLASAPRRGGLALPFPGKLRVLTMSRCDFGLGSGMRNLERLRLRASKLPSGWLPESPFLSLLDVSGSEVGSEADLPSLAPNLKSFIANGSGITGVCLPKMLRLERLEVKDCQRLSFSGELSPTIRTLKACRTAIREESLKPLRLLERASLCQTKVTGKFLQKAPSLSHLKVRGCRWLRNKSFERISEKMDIAM